MVENFSFPHVQKLLSSDGDASLGLDDYQQFTRATDKNEWSGIKGLGFALLGLFGETGSLLSELKKKQRNYSALRAGNTGLPINKFTKAPRTGIPCFLRVDK